ncbi:alpha-amylase [Deltaproteobacteria bacterium Smac51]|nr:alpha-amylase [Deltaproteobacteria bacterium Smac51]
MAQIKVEFRYFTGVRENIFRNVRLMGSWNPDGSHSDKWRTVAMKPFLADDGCQAFKAEVAFQDNQVGQEFSWGILLDVPGRANIWGIMTEYGALESAAMHRTFTLENKPMVESYWLTHCRRLGANKHYSDPAAKPGILFSVWAPHAKSVETVIAADDSGGYIYNDGKGVKKAYPMTRDDQGIWTTDPAEPDFADFHDWRGCAYMFKITREDGSVAYRTDLYSRSQAGTGSVDPAEAEWSGLSSDLEGTKSCSLVLDPEIVAPRYSSKGISEDEWPDGREFWAHEFNPNRPLPTRAEDMVIYEMHVDGLWAEHEGPGTFEDAMNMLDYLVDLGINTIELLPISEFDGESGWGYGTSHYYAVTRGKSGRNQFKHFVRACHQHGIAVIMDVVYNHYTPNSERAEWMYDSTSHEHNMYYMYYGQPDDYPDMPEGGYFDNMSTGYLPNMADEMVRKMMIGSAVTMAMEFHIDGFRMDLTQALHSFNVLHYDGRHVPEANEAGIRFMREWVRTLRLFKPFVVLLAEDHSGWNAMTHPQSIGGIGFDAIWWSEWYHQLIGDATGDKSKARLLHNAGYGTNDPLNLSLFGQILLNSPSRVVYHESHDEAGNSQNSARTMMVAVNNMLFDNTRPWAEARCRVVAALTILSAGTPMFFMGEEVAAVKPYRYDDFLNFREDYQAMRESTGAHMFRFYQDLIRLRISSSAFRSPSLEILYTHNKDRIIAFSRTWGQQEFAVVASLNNNAFPDGYDLTHDFFRGKNWVEALNSDADIYGGFEVYNPDEIECPDGKFKPRIPACGVIVFVKTN